MYLKFGVPDFSSRNNKVNRLDYCIWQVPWITIYQYFSNYENIYFLILSIFQLLTLFLLPREWSPTGPFSTVIPLLLCLLLEIINNIINWIYIWKNDWIENNKEFFVISHKNKHFYLKKIKNQDIYPGNILYLVKHDIIPVNGIILDSNENNIKINLSLLTGESNINYLYKLDKTRRIQNYIDAHLHIDEFYNNIHIKWESCNENLCLHVRNNNYIHAGSILESDYVYVWTISCNSDNTKKNIKKRHSRIDKFVGNYMMNVNVYILIFLITIISLLKIIINVHMQVKMSSYEYAWLFFIYCIQNWILFNGIIPFSIKILLILSRTIEGRIYQNTNISINNISQIDDFGKITRIVCDKTGTITKNKLVLDKIILAKYTQVIDIHQLSNISFPKKVFKCLGLVVNQIGDTFATTEDKIIRKTYQQIGYDIILKDNDVVLMDITRKKYYFEYIPVDGLDFTFERKMSSKVVKNHKDKYYIYSKGSLNSIFQRLHISQKREFEQIEKIMSSQNPELRLLALAYKKLESRFLIQKEMLTNLENDLRFIGIIGIRDKLQSNVKETIKILQMNGIYCSLCTGDRGITALAVAKETGIIDDLNSTFAFSASQITNDNIFIEQLINCKNFVAYDMSPTDKKKIIEILESSKHRTLAIGDGFNDLNMFDKSTISVSIKGNPVIENYADFSIKQFSNLSDLFKISTICYHKNSNSINFTFYRCSMIIFSIVTHCLINYDRICEPIFNGFVLQAFNFAWCIYGFFYYIFQPLSVNSIISIKNAINLTKTSYKCTSLWNLLGCLHGIILISMCYLFEINTSDCFYDFVSLIAIIKLNLVLLFSKKLDFVSCIMCILGIINFIFYLWYVQNLWNIIALIINLPFGFIITLIVYLFDSIKFI